jgi:hypothetical protein
LEHTDLTSQRPAQRADMDAEQGGDISPRLPGIETSDRNFRWVRHKPWDAAISEGETDATIHF